MQNTKNTKVIDLASDTPPPIKKKIQFVFYLNTIKGNEPISTAAGMPDEYDYIELICRNYIDGMDIMLAYDKDQRGDGYLYFGRFNDGAV